MIEFVNRYLFGSRKKTDGMLAHAGNMRHTLIKSVIWIVLTIIDVVIAFPIYLMPKKPRMQCPPIVNNVLLTPATILADTIRKRKISSETVVAAYVSRIKKVNPILNAVVEDRFDRAIRDAQAADRLIRSEKYTEDELRSKFPLLGVPITVKESIAVAGMSNNAGMKSTRGKAKENAEVVKLAVAAGAVPVAVTNTPELCMNWETFNNTTGRTLNPYDSRRTTGGSSGGEAALIAAGASVIGLGSDIAGSLRLPAHFCGIWGHKPTAGAVSLKGHFPDSADTVNWESAFILGPLSRYAIDLPVLLDVVTKEDRRQDLRLHEKVDLSKINIFYMEEMGTSLTHSVDNEIKAAVRKVASHFKTNHRTRTQKFHYKRFENLLPLTSLILLAIDDVEDIFDGDAKKSAWAELLRWCLGRSDFSFFSIAYVIASRLKPERIAELRKFVPRNKKAIEELLGDNGVWICPTFPSVAHFHNQGVAKFYDSVYMSAFNVLGFPVTNCPIGLNSEGIPIGIQVIAATNCDRLTLAVAEEIERAFGGWKPPSFSENS